MVSSRLPSVLTLSRADAVQVDPSDHQPPPPSPVRVGAAEELHGAHDEGAQKLTQPRSQHHGRVCEGAKSGVEGERDDMLWCSRCDFTVLSLTPGSKPRNRS